MLHKLTDALVNRFVDEPDDYDKPESRLQYGRLTGFTGLFINTLLAAGKFVAGYFTGSVALMGDAANNLSDTGSSVVTLVGFHLSSQPPDREHPFGHARSEYIFSAAVAVAVIVVAVQLFMNSVRRILSPEVVAFTPFAIAAMVMAIVFKLWLYLFYRRLGERIDSDILRAQAVDSIADVGSTGAVVVSLLLSPILGFDLDGYMGLVVSFLVVKSGFEILLDNYNSLVGDAPNPEEIQEIGKYILSYDRVIDIHDLVVHNYGGQQKFATVHVEVNADDDWLEAHEEIDEMEHRAEEELGLNLVVHMDPVVLEDPEVFGLQEEVRKVVQEYDEDFDIHDFRMFHRRTRPQIFFDVDIPSSSDAEDETIEQELYTRVKELVPHGEVRLTIDRQFMPATPRRHWTEETYQEALEEEE